jgi:hypothetical protein
VRGVISVSLENASFHMVYTINTLCNWPSIVTCQRGGGVYHGLFILSYSDAVSFRDIRGHLGTIPSIVTFYICACRRRRLYSLKESLLKNIRDTYTTGSSRLDPCFHGVRVVHICGFF